MAGKRRVPGGAPKPLKRVAGAERRQARLRLELDQAVTDADRVIAAADYVRAALVANPDREAAARVEAFLTGEGDRINNAAKRVAS